ncbi:Secreted antigen GbpB/SagA/PcsB, putative peptidoglycan hydrolase [Lactococcus garvieae DCC43]|uniref:Secreted antigen GbpB/SagA/PcsB, putative peptidoglycan hydrolase n=2 Tax=Lactococcus garvieae TaxID=1363 RepID=K2PVH6_9LACT|nr:Secreted antigen GbpB/SagA/PcsB, putative peptidoglycan hydrolase [Lactococcus garvieae DCC43]
MTLMLSTVILTAGAPLATVAADSTEQKIAEQDSKISAVKDEAAKAQSQVDAVEAQVGTLKEKQVSMEKEVEKLLSQQKQQSEQIQELNKNIKERHEGLEAQARSAQTEGSATNYISAVLDSKSLTNAIQKITAMATVADANKAMIEEQEKDQKNIQEKLKDNQAKYEKVTKLQQDLSSQADELATQEAKLKVAQLSYQATVTSEEGKKQELLSQKAEAERAAQAAAEAQKLAEQQLLLSQQEKPKEETVENTPEPVVPPKIDEEEDFGPTPPPPPPPINNQNPYPAGQCTAFVWDYFNGNIPTYMGNAGDWVVYANSGPAANTIAVFSPGNQGAGGVGHVAVVLSVSGSTMTVIEGNFNGGWGSVRECSTAGVSFIRP